MLQTIRRRLRPRRRLNEAGVARAVRFGLLRRVTPISRFCQLLRQQGLVA